MLRCLVPNGIFLFHSSQRLTESTFVPSFITKVIYKRNGIIFLVMSSLIGMADTIGSIERQAKRRSSKPCDEISPGARYLWMWMCR